MSEHEAKTPEDVEFKAQELTLEDVTEDDPNEKWRGSRIVGKDPEAAAELEAARAKNQARDAEIRAERLEDNKHRTDEFDIVHHSPRNNEEGEEREAA